MRSRDTRPCALQRALGVRGASGFHLCLSLITCARPRSSRVSEIRVLKVRLADLRRQLHVLRSGAANVDVLKREVRGGRMEESTAVGPAPAKAGAGSESVATQRPTQLIRVREIRSVRGSCVLEAPGLWPT